MKKVWRAAAVLLLLAAAAFLFLRPQNPAPPAASLAAQISPDSLNQDATIAAPSPNPAADSNTQAVLITQPRTTPLSPQAGELVPDSSPAPDLPPETVLQNVRRAVRQYGEMFDGNPVGDNPEITSQLTGDNPRHINFINPQPGLRVNANGELVDPWGTPYFFHQISGSEMEVHSAGPDKIMWTADDLVVK